MPTITQINRQNKRFLSPYELPKICSSGQCSKGLQFFLVLGFPCNIVPRHILVLQNFKAGFVVTLGQHWRRADSKVRRSAHQLHIHIHCSVDIANLYRAVPSSTRLNLYSVFHPGIQYKTS